MSGFIGPLLASGGSVYLANHSVSATKFFSGTATATFGLGNDGVAYEVENGVTTNYTIEWWTKGSVTGLGAAYECRATLNSGSALSSGTVGSWLTLSSANQWTQSRSTSTGITNSNLTIEIRDVATSTVLASATVTLQAIFEA